MNPDVPPDEAALAADLASIEFNNGVDRGWWQVVDRSGVILTITITASTGRVVTVRADCAGYPTAPPTGQLWSPESDAPLRAEDWPAGGRASEVFSKSWSPSQGGAFYFPYDRRAISGHDVWRTQHPGHVWGVTSTIAEYVQLLREVVRSATAPELAARQEAGQ